MGAYMAAHFRPRLFALSALLLACACGGGGSSDDLKLDVGYDATSRRILVQLTRPVAEGERLHARVRKGALGQLDCARDAAAIERVDGQRFDAPGQPGTSYAGPQVDEALFQPVYDSSWL